jgi:hypothetical protein
VPAADNAADAARASAARPPQSAGKLRQMGCPEGSVVEADISSASVQQMQQALAGCDALVIATSAVPKIKLLSLAKVFWAKITKQEVGAAGLRWALERWAPLRRSAGAVQAHAAALRAWRPQNKARVLHRGPRGWWG